MPVVGRPVTRALLSRRRRERRSFLVALLLLTPLLGIGLFGRALWTPDEPREADIAWRMSVQPSPAFAQFAGAPWLEKPPLSYWFSAAAIRVFGDSAVAARIPNLFYALLVATALFALGARLGGNEAALTAALIGGSALLAWRTSIWLAPDAALIAGTTVALLGAWCGLAAAPGRAKLAGYALLHAGAAWGFLAKSAVGWAVPLLAFGCFILWERRGRELLRWELWAGLAIQLALIGPWVTLALLQPHGRSELAALLWNNIAGRFADVPTFGGPRYASGHVNHPGKYWLELPIYLLPWTAVAAAALLRAATAATAANATGTAPIAPLSSAPVRAAWRFALCACLPWLIVLSLSATARDVYAAPAMTGFALVVGLWVADRAARGATAPRHRGRAAGIALWITFGTVLAIAVTAIAAAALLLATEPFTAPAVAFRLLALVALAAVLWATSARFIARLRAGSRLPALLCCYFAFACSVTVWGAAFFPVIDSWQNLGGLAAQIDRDVGAKPFAILAPDETTIAMMDHPYRRAAVVQPLSADSAAWATAASAWFAAHDPDAQLLVKLPGAAPGSVSRWLEARTGVRLWSDDDGMAAALERAGVVRIARRYALPQGRRFALLARGIHASASP
jgi:4-amino-4-deoxy-L-arabinose transferase-like glycosyltransferase